VSFDEGCAGATGCSCCKIAPVSGVTSARAKDQGLRAKAQAAIKDLET